MVAGLFFEVLELKGFAMVINYGTNKVRFPSPLKEGAKFRMSLALGDVTDKGKGWEFVGPGFTDVKYFGEGAGIAVRKKNQDLAVKFNKAIEAIRTNGTYQKINDKYFEVDVFGD